MVKIAIPFYFSVVVIVEEPLYDIVWCDPLMVAVLTLFRIYICDVNIALMEVSLWMCDRDDSYMKPMQCFLF